MRNICGSTNANAVHFATAFHATYVAKLARLDILAHNAHVAHAAPDITRIAEQYIMP